MKVTLTTLIDITETKARRGDNNFAVNQQANYMTLIQTAGLRVNLDPISLVTNKSNIDNLKFGSEFKGVHKYWTFKFKHEIIDGLTLDLLENDYDLVPIIDNLSETATFKNAVFRTTDNKKRNIFFEIDNIE
jgi:hypothetical protein